VEVYLLSFLMKVSGQLQALAALSLRNGSLVHIGYKAPELVWIQRLREEYSTPARIRTPVIQPIVIHDTA
jgi:hypothetical protein